jgi:DNA-binding MarR family transcriptional regulator
MRLGCSLRTTVRNTRKFAGATSGECGDPAALLDQGSPYWSLRGADYLPYRISLVARLLDRRTTRMLAQEFRMSVAEWRVLAQLAMSSPSSVRDLAEQAWVDRAEVSRASASLVRRGYVRRLSNPRDRRGPLLASTSAGNAVFRRIRPRRAAFHRSLIARLERPQLAALEQALLALARACATEFARLRPAPAADSRPKRARS